MTSGDFPTRYACGRTLGHQNWGYKKHGIFRQNPLHVSLWLRSLSFNVGWYLGTR